MVKIGGTSGVKQLRVKGDLARDQRNWQEAADHYTRYLDQQSDDAAIWVQLGHCKKELGHRDEAERAYLRALSIEPMNPDTHVQIGHIEKLNGRLEQALAWYRKALIAAPDYGPAQHELALVSPATASSPHPSLSKTPRAAEATGSVGSLSKEMEDCIGDLVDRKTQALVDQISAIKAVAVELQRVRRLVETLDVRVRELDAAISSEVEALSTMRDSHTERLAALEAYAPSTQYSFPALLAHVADVNSHREELDCCRRRIEVLEKQLGCMAT